MTRTTPATWVAAAMSVASDAASAGVVFIFQLPAMITGRGSAHVHLRAVSGSESSVTSWSATLPISSKARCTWLRDRSSFAASSANVASGARRRSAATRRASLGSRRSSPRASSASISASCRCARHDRAFEVRVLGVDDAIEMAGQRRGRSDATRARASRRTRPMRRRKSVMRLVLFHVSTPLPRLTRAPAGKPMAAMRRAMSSISSRLDDELEVRAARRDAEGAARQERAAQIGDAAVLAAAVPVEVDVRRGSHQAARRGGRATASWRVPARPHLVRRARPRGSSGARARSRQAPRAARRPDRSAVVPVKWPTLVAGRVAAHDRVRSSYSSQIAAVSLRESCRCAFSSSTTSRDDQLRARSCRGGTSMRTGAAG